MSDPKREGWTMATPFEIPQHRYRYPQGDSLPLAPPEKRLRKRLAELAPEKVPAFPFRIRSALSSSAGFHAPGLGRLHDSLDFIVNSICGDRAEGLWQSGSNLRPARRQGGGAARGLCFLPRTQRSSERSAGRANLAEKPDKKGWSNLDGWHGGWAHSGMIERQAVRVTRLVKKRQTKRDRPKTPLNRLDTLCGKAPRFRRT